MDPDIIQRLENWFSPLSGSLTAFSGGVDSAVVLYLSKRFLGDRGIGVIADSPSLKRSDLEIARSFCSQFDIVLKVIQTNELDNPNYAQNPINRCYYCKDTLYSSMRDMHRRDYSNYTLLNGANLDDQGDYRPGHQAASEQKVRSPLAECGIGKKAIRQLAKEFELPVWDKPASPCLSSRIPYGEAVSAEKLRQIELAESALNRLEFDHVRVRYISGAARIEAPVEDIAKLKESFHLIEPELLSIGFARVEIDAEGFVSGKLNRAISANG